MFQLANDVLVFLIGITYSVISPVIIPVIVIHFGFRYIVWVYQLHYVYVQKIDLCGRLWPRLSSRFVLLCLSHISCMSLRNYCNLIGYIKFRIKEPRRLRTCTLEFFRFLYTRYKMLTLNGSATGVAPEFSRREAGVADRGLRKSAALPITHPSIFASCLEICISSMNHAQIYTDLQGSMIIPESG